MLSLLSSCVSPALGWAGSVAEKHPHLSKTGVHSSQHHRLLQKPDHSGFYQVGTMDTPPIFLHAECVLDLADIF